MRAQSFRRGATARRWSPLLLPAVAIVGFLWGAVSWQASCDDGGGDCASLEAEVSTLVVVLAVAGIALMAGTLLIRFGLRRAGLCRRVTPSPIALVSLGAGLLVLVLPVHEDWDDGCNEHGGRVPLLAAAHVRLLAPQETLAYEESQTDVLCGEPAIPIPRRAGG